MNFDIVNFQIELTNSCNHNCPYCYKDQTNKFNHSMSKEDFKVIYEKIIAINSKVIGIELTGGEPFLNLETVRYAVHLHNSLNNGYDKNITMRINTNLSAISLQDLEKLKNTNLMYSLYVSIPSLKKDIYESTVGVGTYDRFISNLKYVIKHQENFNITANIVITNLNKNDIINTVRKLLVYGVTKCRLGMLHLYDNLSPSQEELAHLYEEFYKLKTKINLDIYNHEVCYPMCLFPDKNKDQHFVCNESCTNFVIDSFGFIKTQSRLNPKGNLILEDINDIFNKFNFKSNIGEICNNCSMYQNNKCVGACSKYSKLKDMIHSCSIKCGLDNSQSWNDLYLNNVEEPVWGKANIPTDIFKQHIPNENVTILDVGCGNGRNYMPFKDMNVKYIGIDISEAAIKYCEQKYNQGHFLVKDFFDLDINADVIIDSTFFHTVKPSKRQRYSEIVNKVLNDKGILMITSFYSENVDKPCFYLKNADIYEWGINDNQIKHLFGNFDLQHSDIVKIGNLDLMFYVLQKK